jgi:Flp pilus assembly protein CpaB
MSDLAYKLRGGVSYRTRNVLIASGLGLLAVVLTLVYVSHAKSSSPTSVAAPVPVLVAAKNIPIGTSSATLAGRGWLVTKTFQPSEVPSGAVKTMAQLSTLVAVQPTYAGEQLVTQRFGTTQEVGLLSVLHGANRVVQVPGDANQLLAGTLKEGNFVDVVGSVKYPETSQTHFATTFLRDLLVVSAPAKPSTGQTTTSIELRVTSAQAQRLFWLEKNADWSLLLRPATKAVDKTTPPTTAGTLLVNASGH